MKKIIICLSIGLLFSIPALSQTTCFSAKTPNQILLSEGDCTTRHAPCSTFKIAISLMGFNEGILINETHPELPFKKGYTDYLERWKQPHTPRLWLQNSCLWFSRVITQKLGMNTFNNYVTTFNYGNQDTSGDKGKDNGLTHSWLSSSLKISPEEQIIFLQKLLNNALPVSVKAHEMTKKILFIEDFTDGWKLYGKTGSGSQLTQDTIQKIGWFVGWLEKGTQTIVFAYYIEDQEDTHAGPRAKVAAKERLKRLITIP